MFVENLYIMDTKIKTQLKPVRSSITEAKLLRNAQIINSYKTLMSIEGSQRVAVAEHIAAETDLNYSLIMRITKDI